MLAPSCTRRTRLCGFLLTALTTSLLCAPDQALGAAPSATAASASTDVVGSTTVKERDGDRDVLGGLTGRLGALQLGDDPEDGSEFRAGRADGSGQRRVEAALGGGDGTGFVVEAHGLGGSLLWRDTFPGGLAQTRVRDLRDRHIAFIAGGDAATSGKEVADWRSHFAVFALQLSSFKDQKGVEHRAPPPFLDANQNSVNNAALKDDAEKLEVAFKRAWPRAGQHPNVEVKKLSVNVIARAGCFSEKWFGVVQALLAPEAERTRQEDHPAAMSSVNAVAALFFPAQGKRAPWAPSYEEARAEWQRAEWQNGYNTFFLGFQAHVMRVQYFAFVGEVSGRQKLVPVRREVRVEKKEFDISSDGDSDDGDFVPEPPDERSDITDNFVEHATGRGVDTLDAGVTTLLDRHVRSGEEGDDPERVVNFGFDDDPPGVHAADGEPGIVPPFDEVRGAKWFVLPAGDDGSDWIPVGEPRLFQDEVYSMGTLLDEIMPKQLHIHWNPTSKEASVHWKDGRSLPETVSLSAAIWNKLKSPFLSSRSWTTTVPDYLRAEDYEYWNRHNRPSIQHRDGDCYMLPNLVLRRTVRNDRSYNWRRYTPPAWWNKKPDYVLVHFARNRDASLLAEYMVTVDKTFGIRWRLRVFRPAWEVTDAGPPGPRLMQDNVLTFHAPATWKGDEEGTGGT